MGLLAVLMGAVLFVPSILFLLENPRTQSPNMGGLFSLKDLLFLLRSILLPPADMHSLDVLMETNWSSEALWMPAGGIALVLAWCTKAGKGSWLRRLLVVYGLMMLFPLTNGLFLLWTANGHCRWFYMPLLLAALAAALALDAPERFPVRRTALGVLAGTVVFQIAMVLLPGAVFRPTLFAWNGFLACASLLGLLLLFGRERLLSARSVLAMVAAGCILSTMSLCWQYRNDRSVAGTAYIDGLRAAEQLKVPAGYRIHDAGNEQMLPGALMNTGTFTSTPSGSIFELYQLLEVDRGVTSRPGKVEGLNELLSGGYSIQEDAWEGASTTSEAHVGQKDYYMYHDRSAPPIGFVYHTYMTRSELAQIAPELRALAMLRTLVVKDEDVAALNGTLRHYDPDRDGGYQPEQKADLLALRASEAAVPDQYEFGRRSFASLLPCGEAGYGFYSIPYDKGWSATVNGVSVPVLNICGLMAVPLAAGLNKVVFRYIPPGLVPGAALSAVGFAGFVLLLWVELRRGGRKDKTI